MATRNRTMHFTRTRATFQSKRQNAGFGRPSGVLQHEDVSGFQRLDASGAPEPANGGGGYDTRPIDNSGAAAGTGMSTHGMAPIYVDKVDAVNDDISTIQQKSKPECGLLICI